MAEEVVVRNMMNEPSGTQVNQLRITHEAANIIAGDGMIEEPLVIAVAPAVGSLAVSYSVSTKINASGADDLAGRKKVIITNKSRFTPVLISSKANNSEIYEEGYMLRAGRTKPIEFEGDSVPLYARALGNGYMDDTGDVIIGVIEC